MKQWESGRFLRWAGDKQSDDDAKCLNVAKRIAAARFVLSGGGMSCVLGVPGKRVVTEKCI